MSLWNKIKWLNLNIFRTRCCKPLIFQTQIIWSNRIHNLNYLRSATFVSKDIVNRKSEFVEKTQFISGASLWPRSVSSFYITFKYKIENLSELKTLKGDILNHDRLIWSSNVHTLDFLLNPLLDISTNTNWIKVVF